MPITIDTDKDSYEVALAALNSAYGLRHREARELTVLPAARGEDPGRAVVLSTETIPEGWTEQETYETLLTVKPNALAVLRVIAANAPLITFDDVVASLHADPDAPHFGPEQLGRTMTSVASAMKRRRAGQSRLVERDPGRHAYVMDVAVAAAVLRVFAARRT